MRQAVLIQYGEHPFGRTTKYFLCALVFGCVLLEFCQEGRSVRVSARRSLQYLQLSETTKGQHG